MQEFFLKHKKRIIGAGIAILVLVTVIASGIKLNATLLESAIGVVVTPFQDLTTGISSWIDDTVTSARNKTKLKDENEELKQQIADLQEQNRQKDTEHQNELKTLKLTNAIKMAISSTAQDSDLVAGLVDRNKLILGEDGKVAGLEEQVKALKESKPFLFKQEQQTGKGKKGFFPLGAPKTEPGGEEGHMSMKEAIAAKLNLGSEGKGE